MACASANLRGTRPKIRTLKVGIGGKQSASDAQKVDRNIKLSNAWDTGPEHW